MVSYKDERINYNILPKYRSQYCFEYLEPPLCYICQLSSNKSKSSFLPVKVSFNNSPLPFNLQNVSPNNSQPSFCPSKVSFNNPKTTIHFPKIIVNPCKVCFNPRPPRVNNRLPDLNPRPPEVNNRLPDLHPRPQIGR